MTNEELLVKAMKDMFFHKDDAEFWRNHAIELQQEVDKLKELYGHDEVSLND